MSDADPAVASEGACVARRTVLRGAAALGGVAVVAACGGQSQTTDAGGTDSAPAGGGGGSASAGKGTVLGPVAEVPAGGGTIYDGPQIVVTQPATGEFRAFSSICTHAGCPVSSVTDTINCNCHGSQYSLEDGSVVSGPAPKPLSAKDVTVKGANLVLE